MHLPSPTEHHNPPTIIQLADLPRMHHRLNALTYMTPVQPEHCLDVWHALPLQNYCIESIISPTLLLPLIAVMVTPAAREVLLPVNHDAQLPLWYPYINCPIPCNQLNLTLKAGDAGGCTKIVISAQLMH